MSSKKSKSAKLLVVSGAMFASSLVAINPQQAGASSNVEALVKNAENLANALKWEISYDHRKIAYPKNVFDYPNMKLFNETKAAMFAAEKALTDASGNQKQILKARLDQNVKTHYDRAVRYIDSVTAGKKILAKSDILKDKLIKNSIDDSTENAYHALSREIKRLSPIMYKTYGKSTRDALVNYYQGPAYETKDDALYPVSIKIEIDRLNKALVEKDTDKSIHHTALLEKYFVDGTEKGLLKEGSVLYTKLSDSYKASYENFIKLVPVLKAESKNINSPTVVGGTANAIQKYENTIVITAGKGQYIKLANAEVNGNIVIKGDHTGAGTVYLENVKVNKVNNYGGAVIVEDVAEHSLYLTNTNANILQVNDSNDSNIVMISGRINAVNLAENAGARGGITLESRQKGALGQITIASKGTQESKGVTLSGDFSDSKVILAGLLAQVKAAADAKIKEMEIIKQASLEAAKGAYIESLNLALKEKGELVDLQGDFSRTTVNILNANATIQVAKDTQIKEIRKDPSVPGNVSIINNGTIETATGVTVGNNPPTGTTPPSTGGGSSSGGGGGSVVDRTAPTVEGFSTIGEGENVYVRSNELGNVYLVPANETPITKNDLDALVLSGKVVKQQVQTVNGDIEFVGTNLLPGEYKIYAVDNSGNVSSPKKITIIKRVTAGVIVENSGSTEIRATVQSSDIPEGTDKVAMLSSKHLTILSQFIDYSLDEAEKIDLTNEENTTITNDLSSFDEPNGEYNVVVLFFNSDGQIIGYHIDLVTVSDQVAQTPLELATAAKNNFKTAYDNGSLDWDTLITAIHYLKEARAVDQEAVSDLEAYYADIENLDMSNKDTSRYAISTGALVDFTGLKTLDLSGVTNITELGGLVRATELTTLNISGTKVTELNVLWNGTEARFPNLTNIQAKNIDTLTSIGGLVEVTNVAGFSPVGLTWNLGGSILAEDPDDHIGHITSKFSNGGSFTAPTLEDSISTPLELATAAKGNFKTAYTNGSLDWDTLITAIHYLNEARTAGEAVSELEAYYAGIENLDMSNKDTSRYAISTGALVDFTGLKKLDLSGVTNITELGGLVGATELTTLNISGTKVTELNVLWNGTEARFPNLTNIQAKNIDTLTSIGGLVEVTNVAGFSPVGLTWNLGGSILAEDPDGHIGHITSKFSNGGSFTEPVVRDSAQTRTATTLNIGETFTLEDGIVSFI